MSTEQKKSNVYELVTNKVLDALKQGVAPWQKPWDGGNGYISHESGKPYSYLNGILIALDGDKVGEYLTMKQIQKEGCKLKKGAKSKLVVFYKMVESKVKALNEDNIEEEIVKRYPTLKYYLIFHIDDVEGIEPKWGDPMKIRDNNPIDDAESVITSYLEREKHLQFRNQEPSDRAFYSPSRDLVQVPMLNQYDVPEEYYSTTFHEFTHSTGIKTRCDRGLEVCAAFGSEKYSKEELVAEMGSAIAISRLGIDSEKCFKNSVSYLKGWMEAISKDNKLIVIAAGKAEKAVKYIFGEKE